MIKIQESIIDCFTTDLSLNPGPFSPEPSGFAYKGQVPHAQNFFLPHLSDAFSQIDHLWFGYSQKKINLVFTRKT